MAKLPTFSASNVSGGGGAVQMQAQQRATTKPFRQSTNIRAEDIYNQAGDQAMAQAIGNIGSLFNKVQLQKTEATYVQKKNEMREAFGRAMMDAEKEGKNADNYYRNWLKQTKDTLTKTVNSAIDKRLEMDYSTMSVNSSLDVINYVSKVAREEYLGNGVQLEKDFEVAISKGEITPEDAIHEVNLYYQNGAGNGGFFSMETAQEKMEEASTRLYFIDAKSKIENSTDLDQLETSRKLAETTEFLLGANNVETLNGLAESRMEKIKNNNRNSNLKSMDEDLAYTTVTGIITQEALDTVNSLPEQYAQQQLTKLENARDSYAFRTDLDNVDSLEDAESVFKKHINKKGIGTGALISIQEAYNGWKVGFNEKQKQIEKLQVAQVSNTIAKELSKNPFIDVNSVVKNIVDSNNLSESQKSMLAEKFKPIAKEFEDDWVTASLKYHEKSGDLFEARSRNDIQAQASILRDIIPSNESRIVDDYEMNIAYNAIRDGDPNGYNQLKERWSALYGDKVGYAYLDTATKIIEGKVPKGFTDDNAVVFIAGNDLLEEGDTAAFEAIGNSLKNKKNWDKNINKSWNPIASSIDEKYGHRNDEAFIYKKKAVQALFNYGYDKDEAEKKIFGNQISIGQSTIPKTYIRAGGRKVEIDANQLEFKMNKIEQLIRSDAQEFISEKQLNQIVNEGGLRDQIDVSINRSNQIVVSLFDGRNIVPALDKENNPIIFDIPYLDQSSIYRRGGRGPSIRKEEQIKSISNLISNRPK